MTARWVVRVLALLAFGQTLAYYAYLRDDPGNYNGAGQGGDQVAYVELAQQVLHGTWQGAVHYMPGLPAVIAAGQLVFGDPRLGIAIVQGVVFAALVLLAAQLASRAFGPRSRPWAAALVALNPAIGYYASQALTEFLTGAVLFALAWTVWRMEGRSIAARLFFPLGGTWTRRRSDAARLSYPLRGPAAEPRGDSGDVVPKHSFAASGAMRRAAMAGLLVALAGYLRAEYLALAAVMALVLWWVHHRDPRPALVLLAATALVIAPWVLRYTIATGKPALYNESPFSNLVLMGTWFRVFDEQTFTQLQRIETTPGPREEAIAEASTVGPRPDLSARYMAQTRGPYDLPLGQTLSIAADNIRLNPRQYLVNHVLLAPVLIWAGHTPVRQADAPRLPSTLRYTLWAAELAVLLLALWQALRGLSTPRTQALSLAILAIVAFLTAVHVLIAVDERFTTPALPLLGTLAGARLAELASARREGWLNRPVLASARRAR